MLSFRLWSRPRVENRSKLGTVFAWLSGRRAYRAVDAVPVACPGRGFPIAGWAVVVPPSFDGKVKHRYAVAGLCYHQLIACITLRGTASTIILSQDILGDDIGLELCQDGTSMRSSRLRVAFMGGCMLAAMQGATILPSVVRLDSDEAPDTQQ